MQSIRFKICALLLSASAVSVTGCFGDSVLSAASKVLSGQISQLTGAEIRILNQTAVDLLEAANIGYQGKVVTLEQADALSIFIKANEINTIQDFELLASKAKSNPDEIEGLDALGEAFAGEYDDENGEFDPESLEEIFGAIIGGVDPDYEFGGNGDGDEDGETDPGSGGAF